MFWLSIILIFRGNMYVRLDLSVRNQVTVQQLNSAAEVVMPVPHPQALGVIADALKEWGVAPADVQGIAVVVGVGAFTATRVATTIANAWAYVHGVPVIGVGPNEILVGAELVEKFKHSSRFLSATYSGTPAIGKS